ncbi:hypothetical protein C8R44DRAFT_822481 [Mycena epipterygia]|nr:hypothetical protein C8R44DRAFT_822481 [Mycena epipterygia]
MNFFLNTLLFFVMSSFMSEASAAGIIVPGGGGLSGPAVIAIIVVCAILFLPIVAFAIVHARKNRRAPAAAADDASEVPGQHTLHTFLNPSPQNCGRYQNDGQTPGTSAAPRVAPLDPAGQQQSLSGHTPPEIGAQHVSGYNRQMGYDETMTPLLPPSEIPRLRTRMII